MNFGDILPHLKSGSKARRAGWGTLYGSIEIKMPKRQDEHAELIVTYDNGVRTMWMCSANDLIAEDWETV